MSSGSRKVVFAALIGNSLIAVTRFVAAGISGILDILMMAESIDDVNEVLTMHMGPYFILANISVDFDDRRSADEIEDVIANIHSTIRQQYPQIKRIFIEAEKWCNQ